MLSAIFASIGGAFIDKFFGAARDIFHDYTQGKISEAECRTRLLTAALDSLKAVEVSHSETLAKTYATFWNAAADDKSGLMKRMWAIALSSQIFVLFWSQWCVPLLFAFGLLPNWKAGTSAEWAYLLVGALLGLGPLVLRAGPGALDTNKLKGLIGK